VRLVHSWIEAPDELRYRLFQDDARIGTATWLGIPRTQRHSVTRQITETGPSSNGLIAETALGRPS
jgi:hypothetical protein